MTTELFSEAYLQLKNIYGDNLVSFSTSVVPRDRTLWEWWIGVPNTKATYEFSYMENGTLHTFKGFMPFRTPAKLKKK